MLELAAEMGLIELQRFTRGWPTSHTNPMAQARGLPPEPSLARWASIDRHRRRPVLKSWINRCKRGIRKSESKKPTFGSATSCSMSDAPSFFMQAGPITPCELIIPETPLAACDGQAGTSLVGTDCETRTSSSAG